MRTSLLLVFVAFFVSSGVVWAQPGAPVVIESVGVATGSMSGGFGSADVELRVAIREAAGKSVTLAGPAVISLLRDTAAGAIAADYGAIDVIRGGTDTKEIKLGPHERAELVVRIRGLRDAGKYSGQLVMGGDGAEARTPVSVMLRNPWWVAVALILAGVVLATLMRTLAGGYRDSLALQQKLLLLQDQMKRVRAWWESPSAHDVEVLDIVGGQLSELRFGAEAGQPLKNEQLVMVASKVSNVRAYLVCHRRAAALNDADLTARLAIVRIWLGLPLDDPDAEQRRKEAEKALTEAGTKVNNLPTPSDSALAAELEQLMQGDKPPGVTDVAWTNLRDQVHEAGSADVQHMRVEVLTTLVTGLRSDTEEELELASQQGKPERSADLQTALDELRQAGQFLPSQPEQARVRYERAREARGRTDLLGQSMGTEAPSVAALSASMTQPNGEQVRVHRLLTARQLRWRRFGVEAAVATILGLIAVVLGLQLLYVNQFTWGSPLDWILAFLWGLGLHPVGGAVFGGLDALRQRVTNPSTTAG